MEIQYEVTVNGEPWHVHGAYDATHVVVGALLAGADEINIRVQDAPDRVLYVNDESDDALERVQEEIRRLREGRDPDPSE